MQIPAILLATSDPEEGARLARILRLDGYRVVAASKPAELDAAHASGPFDLLVIDGGWGGTDHPSGRQDAFAAAGQCSRKWPGIGLILIIPSAGSGQGIGDAGEESRLALRFGFDDCIHRPFGDVELLAAAHYVLHLASTRRDQVKRLKEVEERLASWEAAGTEASASDERIAGARSLARVLRADLQDFAAAAATSFKAILTEAEAGREMRLQARALLTHLNHLHRLVGRLEALSPDGPSVWQPVNLSSVVDQAVALFEEPWRERGIDVRVEMPPELPRIRGDRSRLLQAFINLLANAGEALEDAASRGQPRPPFAHPPTVGLEGEAGYVHILGRVEGDEVMVTVSDSSPGIPEWAHHNLFDPFFAPAPHRRSAGFALFCCREIVRDHNGSIRVESAPDGGTRLSMVFPRPSALVADQAKARASQKMNFLRGNEK